METEKNQEFSSFDELKNYYDKKLPLSIEDIFSKVMKISSGKQSMETLSEIRNSIHKLAGSAGSFGYSDLGEILAGLDKYFSVLIENNEWENGFDIDYIKSEFEKIAELLSRPNTASPSCSHAVTAMPSSHGRVFEKIPENWNKRINICNPYGKKYLEDLSGKLSYFGYSIDYCLDLEKTTAAAENGEIYLVVIEIDSLAGEPGLCSRISRVRESNKYFKIIFTSENNDFETRLAAIRSGGDAFFECPINIIKLIDKIDNFTDSRRIKPDHILIIDDDMDTLSYYARLFQESGMLTSVTTDPSSAFDLIIEAEPDLILIDMLMPGCNGIELASVIRQHEDFVSIPIVLYSAFDSPPVSSPFPFSGDDFVSKSMDDETIVRIIKTRIGRSKSLRYFIERDSLTGLLNHSNLNDSFYRELVRSDRLGLPLSYAMIDLDNFKSVNDQYGHLAGDTILKNLAYMLVERLRTTDIIGRYGGEEFVVVMGNTTTVNAKKVIDSIREKFFSITHTALGHEFNVSFSCGIAGYPDFSLAETISEAADKALYEAKKQGKNRVVIYGVE